MKALIVLPPDILQSSDIQRALYLTQYVAPDADTIDFAAPATHAGLHESMTMGQRVFEYSERLLADYATLLYLESPDGKIVPDTKIPKGITIYHLCRHKTDLVDFDADREAQQDWPINSIHPFNIYGPRHNQFYYFPYGYLFRNVGNGPVNKFGHRISIELNTLINRPKNHIVIAVFGGSAAWSIFTTPHEMFHHRLENLLNEKYSPETVFTVLNFGVPGNVILNEMIVHMLHCHRIRPDIVIAHDGFNDFAYGQTSNVDLLAENDITYQTNLEDWSRILHDTSHIPLDRPRIKGALAVRTRPRFVIDAYIARQIQFQEIVKGQGGVFVAALQPAFFSKSALSRQEKRIVPEALTHDHIRTYRNMPYLYELYTRKQPAVPIEHFANIHAHFGNYGKDHHLFVDHMHTTPAGDAVIAEYYSEYLAEYLLPEILQRSNPQ